MPWRNMLIALSGMWWAHINSNKFGVTFHDCSISIAYDCYISIILFINQRLCIYFLPSSYCLKVLAHNKCSLNVCWIWPDFLSVQETSFLMPGGYEYIRLSFLFLRLSFPRNVNLLLSYQPTPRHAHTNDVCTYWGLSNTFTETNVPDLREETRLPCYMLS